MQASLDRSSDFALAGTTAERHRPVPSLARNFLWSTGGNVCFAASQWAMVVVLSKFAGTAAVGWFSLALAFTTPLFLLANLNLRAILATDAAGQYRFSEYAALRLLTILAAVAIAAGGAAWGPYGTAGACAIGAAALAKAVESSSDLHYGREQRRERLDRVSVSLAARGLLSLLALAAITLAGGSVATAFLGIAAAWLAVLIFWDGRGAALWRECARADFGRVRSLARLALPLGLATMLISFNLNVPRYFLERERGEAAVGIFSALSYFGVAGNLLLSALAQSAAPQLADRWQAADRRGFLGVTARLIALALALGIGGLALVWLAGAPLVTLAYRAEYAAHPRALWLLMAAAAMQYLGTALGTAVTALRRFAIQFPIHAGVTALSLALAPFWIHRHGIEGAAGTLLAASAAATLPYALLLWRSLR